VTVWLRGYGGNDEVIPDHLRWGRVAFDPRWWMILACNPMAWTGSMLTVVTRLRVRRSWHP
jgi:hypothetical protein